MSDREQWCELVRKHVHDWNTPATAKIWSPALEALPREQLRRIQDEKVAGAYTYLWNRSTFYRQKFEQAGLGPDSVRSVEDLPRVPVTLRDEWLVDQQKNPPWGTFSPLRQEDWLERGWMMFSTSGTTAAHPRSFRHTNFDREMWAWHGSRALHAMGVRRGDIAINCFSYGTSVAFWGLHYALNHMGIPVISGGGANTERRILFIETYKPTVLLCTPSYALYLGRQMQEQGKSPKDSSIRLLVCAGEPGACVPATKQRIEELWGARINDDFGCTEVAMSPFGYTCEYQVNREDGRVDTHFMEDAYVPEVLDPETFKPVPDGQRGVLVVSNLFSEAQPILRYVMGDWVSLTREACPCGRTHARAIGGLAGRYDQLIKIRGLAFLPALLEDSIRSQQEIGDEFKLEITHVNDMDEILLTTELHPGASMDDLEAQEQRLSRKLKGSLGIVVDVKLVPPGTLPRTEFKAKRLFDLRDRRQ
ncbi:phenylacetate--CoA ligase family protein [Stigmatella erecta]|uniref:Phenylacetate-CoA ligase n=1 Tax=Stigmatella erecta TaxID=83460 RepID=A0A1I0IIJ3_9BACT|nr:AMP-binding protein [Stigmatella erecta]SET96744.1 phenylacetate-CoA ligase [Stigmatella erecta]